MVRPRHRDVKDNQIPEVVAGEGIKIKIICGEVSVTGGPVRDIVAERECLNGTFPPGIEFIHPTEPGHKVSAHVIGGKVCFCRERKPFAHDVEEENYFDFRMV